MKKWEEQEKLGFGKFGVVYSCARPGSSETARPSHARKRLQADWKKSEEVCKRFAREIDILRSLEHENVMPVVDSGQNKAGVPWFVMPLADGGSLRDAIEDGRTEDLDWSVRVFKGALRGMDHAHSNNVFHRDLKPRNILLFGDEPKVSDFGIAKQLDLDGTTLTRTAQELGTLRYMAPEQLANAKAAAKPADVYALGKIFVHMVTGRSPEPMKVDVSSMPEEFRFFVDKCCREDPIRRFPDAGAALEALEQITEDRSVHLPAREQVEVLIAEALEALGTSDEMASLEALDSHVRANPLDDGMHRQHMPRIPRPVVRAWISRLPEGYRDALRGFDAHIDESGGLPYSYCDIVADHYVFVFGVAADFETKRIVLARLIDMGTSHNRFYVRDVVVNLLAGIDDPTDASIAEEAIDENPHAAEWYSDGVLQRSPRKPIAEALVRAQETSRIPSI